MSSEVLTKEDKLNSLSFYAQNRKLLSYFERRRISSRDTDPFPAGGTMSPTERTKSQTPARAPEGGPNPAKPRTRRADEFTDKYGNRWQRMPNGMCYTL